jgi:DNA-binding NtrC family response regulator
MEKLKILVVDDEDGIRSGVRRVLTNFVVSYPFMEEDIGFEIIDVVTGEEAIRKIREERPDLVLLDNKLPGISGIEVLEYINNNFGDTGVMMITSFASLELAVKATQNGAYDFVPKPFTPQELKSSVENFTKKLFLRRMASQSNEEPYS